MADGCDDNMIRAHEHRMGQNERAIIRLDTEIGGVKKDTAEQLRLMTAEISGVRLDVQRAVSEGMEAIISGVSGDAREALTTAKSAHRRMDDFVGELRSVKSMQTRLAVKVASILAALTAGGAGIWNVVTRIFGGGPG
ncbi:MAG: hypothetical protein K8R59_08170 [Thermoanaerobaculales bacterium]|nr:hypothetical protein [Thermoanaerobaculales bacterium]